MQELYIPGATAVTVYNGTTGYSITGPGDFFCDAFVLGTGSKVTDNGYYLIRNTIAATKVLPYPPKYMVYEAPCIVLSFWLGLCFGLLAFKRLLQ